MLEGLVVGVSEGDRITVNSFGTEIVVRLYGISAPHTAKVDKFTGWYKAGQPYADDAFRALSIKVLHQQVRIDIRKTMYFKQDPKQIAVAVVYLDGRNINLEMLSDGLAWVHDVFRADHSDYFTAEKRARMRKIGLWSQGAPQATSDSNPNTKIKR